MLSEITAQCSGCVATLTKLLVELSIIRKQYLAEYFIFYYLNILDCNKNQRFFAMTYNDNISYVNTKLIFKQCKTNSIFNGL